MTLDTAPGRMRTLAGFLAPDATLCEVCGGTGENELDFGAWIVSRVCGYCDGEGGWNDEDRD